jgi:hypothetical protein
LDKRPKLKKINMRFGAWNVRSLGCMDWIHLAQDRDQRRALVNTVMNLRDVLE